MASNAWENTSIISSLTSNDHLIISSHHITQLIRLYYYVAKVEQQLTKGAKDQVINDQTKIQVA
jgi:hypothetical protein